MKCNNCNSEWASNFEVFVCPFCGKRLKDTQITTDISMALSKIVKDFGPEILNNPNKVVACIMDYVLENQRDKKMLRIASENGIFELMFTARKAGQSEQQKAICEKAVRILEDDAFLSEQNARHIIYLIADGLNIAHITVNYEKKIELTQKTKTAMSSAFIQKEQISDTKKEAVSKGVNTIQKISESKPQSPTKTREYYIDLAKNNNKAAKREDADKIYKIGQEEFKKNHYNTAISCFRLASKFGNRDAYMIMGYCYEQGIGISRDAQAADGFYHLGEISNPTFNKYCLNNKNRSVIENRFFYARMLLNNPTIFATHNEKPTVTKTQSKSLTEILESMRRVEPLNFSSKLALLDSLDKKRCIEYLQQRIESNAKATEVMKNLIMNFGREFLKEREYQKGIKWIKYAANHGCTDADFILGYCYDIGIGVPKDAKIAEAFYLRGSNSSKRYGSSANRFRETWLRQVREDGRRLYLGKPIK